MTPSPEGEWPSDLVVPPDTAAVVLTHRRERLATMLVRSLLMTEGFAPSQIILVIDRDGGLDDPELEAAIRVIRLEVNSGPAAGFRAGMKAAFADASVRYAYVCEDDVGLMGLPAPRVVGLREAVETYEHTEGRPVGAVLAYGRRFGGRAGSTQPFIPSADGPRLQPVDVGSWGATLMTRRAFESGVRPDDYWYFAYEDFDFCLQIAQRGLAVLIDRDSGLATAPATVTNVGRDEALRGARPDDAAEPWRAFYVARNVFELTRRYGDARWLGWHLLLSGRRFQLAPTWAERRALLVGLAHGVLRRSGRNARYVRAVGELPAAVEGGVAGDIVEQTTGCPQV